MNAVAKYNSRAEAVNSLLCVGLDSDINRLSEQWIAQSAPQYAFNRHMIDLTAHSAAAYKFNMAFYEERGADGWRDLAASLQYLHTNHPDVFTICDAKRADIGNSSAAYARAIFEQLGFDAVTLNPFLGSDALQPFLDYRDKACIVLCRTSNAGSGEFQNQDVAGKKLWQLVAEVVAEKWNCNDNCMLVAAATYPNEMAEIRASVGEMTLLVPGIGAQAGDIEAVIKTGLNRSGKGLIINASRSIIFADDPASSAANLRDKINNCRS